MPKNRINSNSTPQSTGTHQSENCYVRAIHNESDLKTSGEEQSADQSAKNTRSDKPSNLISHDKDHTGDP
jgi:hypothetical protein